MDLDPLTEEYQLWRLVNGWEPDFATLLLLGRMTEDAEALGSLAETENDDEEE